MLLPLLTGFRHNVEFKLQTRDFLRHTVTFRITTANNATKSELPGDWPFWVRVVGAKVPSFDSSGQVVPERWDCLADFLDGFLNTFCHSRTRSFRVRGSLAVPAPKSDSGCEIVDDRL